MVLAEEVYLRPGRRDSPEALAKLRRVVLAILRDAAARASQAKRSEVTAEDVKPVGSR